MTAYPTYDVILVGTGFASSFFLAEYLEKAGPAERVLVLERGYRDTHQWHLQQRRFSRFDHYSTYRKRGIPNKRWVFSLAFGGGSNCWWACTPRLLPNDFRLRTLYGVGRDWPIGYEDLAADYQKVEEIMQVSGPEDGTPFPRRHPYPQPPHRFSAPDEILKQAYPDQYFQQPTARARIATGTRGVCCGNGVCHLCPVDAKFTIENGLSAVYDDPRITLRLNAEVRTVETEAGVARRVSYLEDSQQRSAAGDLVVLGANALFNPVILMRSGFSHPLLGRRLNEQVSLTVFVDLDGVDNFQGSTAITGHGYMLYDGPHRGRHAACLIEGWNQPRQLRWEPGRWKQLLELKFIFEDLPEARNRVIADRDDPLPTADFKGYSSYTHRAVEALEDSLPKLLAPLPVEAIHFDKLLGETESHILGTVVMGDDPQDSVVDRHLIHHQVRNLLVLGGSAFPTSSPANPTLTISALAMRSARHLHSSGTVR